MSLYQNLFYTDFTHELCSDERMVSLMLEAEWALVKAQEEQGIIPKDTTTTLSGIFRTIEIDIEKLKRAIPLTGNAAAPLVKQLVAEVKKQNEEAAKYIHLGATSQDIVDTATILKAKHFLFWLHEKIATLEQILTQLTHRYRNTVMMGRTLMQQARPITFGLKTAIWLEGIRSLKQQLQSAENELLCIQLGGAVGSQNQYLNRGVRHSFAQILGLRDSTNWHTQRGNLAAFASALGVLMGNLAKIANDIVLLSQTEVGEVFEPSVEGRGTSSTMPHKRNPVLCTSILANAHRVPFGVASLLAAMPQAHERSAGRWQAEWKTLDDLLGLTAGAMEKSIELLGGLEVNEERMRQNIELTSGLIFAETVALALAEKAGKQAAHDLIKKACQTATAEGKHLLEIVEQMDLGFTSKELSDFFQPEHAIGDSLDIIDEILANK